MRLLEAEVGGPLLERLPRGARLTPAGRALLPEARAAVRAAPRGTRAARSALALELAELEVSTVMSLAVGLLPDAIQRMCEDHPGMAVRLHEFSHRDLLVAALDAGVGDVAVGPTPPAHGGPQRKLGWESFVAIVNRRHPSFASPGPVRIDSLANDPWVLFPTAHGLLDLVLSVCAQAGFVPRDAVRTAQVEAAVRLAAAGLGVAIVPANIVPPHLAEYVRTLDPPVVRELVVYARSDWSPQSLALIASLEAAHWPDRPAGALVIP
jgi:DNA-binding transcriptional LysR family regulator